MESHLLPQEIESNSARETLAPLWVSLGAFPLDLDSIRKVIIHNGLILTVVTTVIEL